MTRARLRASADSNAAAASTNARTTEKRRMVPLPEDETDFRVARVTDRCQTARLTTIEERLTARSERGHRARMPNGPSRLRKTSGIQNGSFKGRGHWRALSDRDR